MYAQVEKPKDNKRQSVANQLTKKQNGVEFTFQFENNLPEVVEQQNHKRMVNNSIKMKQLIAFQKVANKIPQYKQYAQPKAMVTTIQKKIETSSLDIYKRMYQWQMAAADVEAFLESEMKGGLYTSDNSNEFGVETNSSDSSPTRIIIPGETAKRKGEEDMNIIQRNAAALHEFIHLKVAINNMSIGSNKGTDIDLQFDKSELESLIYRIKGLTSSVDDSDKKHINERLDYMYNNLLIGSNGEIVSVLGEIRYYCKRSINSKRLENVEAEIAKYIYEKGILDIEWQPEDADGKAIRES